MKRLLIAVFLLSLLLSIPVFATEEVPYTPLSFGTSKDIRAIHAIYQINTEEIESFDVKFPDSWDNGMYEYYFKDGFLTIDVASSSVLDLDDVFIRVTATLKNGNKVAPSLKIERLKLDGKNVTKNLSHGTATITKNNNDRILSIPVYDDFSGNNYLMFVAIYQENGKLVSAQVHSILFEENETQKTVFVKWEDAEEIAKIKLFFTDLNFFPVLKTTNLMILD